MLARISCLFLAALALLTGYAPSSYAQSTAPAALTGKVSSAEEGLMEGVVVRAKKGIVTISVVSNAQGEFSFPAAKLEPGTYTLSIRATGYDLTGPSTVTLAGAPLNLDLKLVPTKNIAAQLTNLEWILSVPGNERQKNILSRCVNCHTLERVVDNKHDVAAWKDVIARMATYSNNSFHRKPQVRKEARDMDRFVPNVDEVATYLASINRSAGDFAWQPKPVKRVSGAGTRVVITEYDLPDPTIQPHDVIVDNDGIVWHSDFSGQMLGRFDTKTLAHRAYQVPLQREGWPTGALDLESDPQGNLWLGLMFQAGTAKFDRKTETFQMFQLPPNLLKADSQQAMVGVQNWTVDNRIWLQDPARRGIYRMDLTNGQTQLFEPFKVMPRSSPYGVFSDKQNNVWFLDFGGENVGTIDANSGEVTLYQTPTRQSRPRRGRIDDQGRVWFAEFSGERVGVFDTKTKQFKEWQVPGQFFSPYDVTHDRLGNIWTGGMNADRIVRISTESGEVTEYPLPHATNIRRVFVDNNTTPPTFWVGNNHGAALIKLEPLD